MQAYFFMTHNYIIELISIIQHVKIHITGCIHVHLKNSRYINMLHIYKDACVHATIALWCAFTVPSCFALHVAPCVCVFACVRALSRPANLHRIHPHKVA